MELLQELQEAEDKLDKFLEENLWTMRANKKRYPVTFTFRKEQTSWNTKNEEAPEIQLIFKSETEYVMSVPDDERIDEKFFNKLKSLAKEVHRLYLLYWFSMKDVRFEKAWNTLWPACDGKETVGLLGSYYEP